MLRAGCEFCRSCWVFPAGAERGRTRRCLRTWTRRCWTTPATYIQRGSTTEERFDNLLRQDSVLRELAGDANRLTPVMEYTNYQLVSSRVAGPGWALVGDTAGFIDPVFSSGLFIGMHSAFALADAIHKGSPEAFKKYEREVIHHLETWHEIVDYFYNGRLFTCFHVGQMLRDTLLVKLSFPHLNKHMGRIFSGAASTSPYSLALLRFAMTYGMKDEDPRELMIR